MAFDESKYDLNTKEGREAYIADWKVDLKERGYRIGEDVEKDASGWTTLAGLAHMTDIRAHNISLTMKDTIDLLGGRGTEAGKGVSNLWHNIVAHDLHVRNIATHLAEKEAARGPINERVYDALIAAGQKELADEFSDANGAGS